MGQSALLKSQLVTAHICGTMVNVGIWNSPAKQYPKSGRVAQLAEQLTLNQ